MTEQQLAERRAMIEAACEGRSCGRRGPSLDFAPETVSSPPKKRKTQQKLRKAPKKRNGVVASAVRSLAMSGPGPFTVREIANKAGVRRACVILEVLRRRGIPVAQTRLGPGVEMTPMVRRWCGMGK